MKRIISTFVFLTLSLVAFTQAGGGIISFNYSVGMTMGSSKDFVSPVSGRGFNLDVRFNVTENISIGGLVGWNYFHERLERNVYQTTGSNGAPITINAMQVRSFNMLPLMFQTQYHFISGSNNIKPYVGLGLGGIRVDYEKYWADLLDEKEQWVFGLSPQVGVLIPFASDLSGINIEVKYNWANFSYNEVNSVSYLDANIGVFFDF
ncbi:outer membrane beta-barrel protein [Cyclobacteriaceae bacterium]|nr:outer membrane beta-barrel protein [Cyclobacteriaceae bacterium]